MDRRTFLAVGRGVGRACPRSAAAQSPEKPENRLADRATGSEPDALSRRPPAGFGELGYVEGQNLIIEYRFGNDQLDRVPALAAELVKSGVRADRRPGRCRVGDREAHPSCPHRLHLQRRSGVGGLGRQPVASARQHDRRDPDGRRAEQQAAGNPARYRSAAYAASPSSPIPSITASISSAPTREETGQRLGIEIRYYPTPSPAALDAAFAAIKADPRRRSRFSPTALPCRTGKLIFDFAS